MKPIFKIVPNTYHKAFLLAAIISSAFCRNCNRDSWPKSIKFI